MTRGRIPAVDRPAPVRWFDRPAFKVAALCAGLIALCAGTRLRSLEQVRSPRFVLMCGVVATAGLLAWAWQFVTRRNWTWHRTFLTIALGLLVVLWLLVLAYGR